MQTWVINESNWLNVSSPKKIEGNIYTISNGAILYEKWK